jgi:hypothetical protein
MKRSTFFAYLLGLAGIASAQRPQAEPRHGEVFFGKEPWEIGLPDPPALVAESGNTFLVKRSLVNGKCPVCGTMAKAFRPIPVRVDCTTDDAVPNEGGLLKCGSSIIQAEQIIRCQRCNAAFWQDAEKTE